MAERKHRVDFKANPTQYDFIRSTYEADLWSCRMGEGKTAAIPWSCFYHTQRNPGAKWLIIRDTWESNRDTTQAEFFKWFPPGTMGEYTAGTKTFKWTAKGMAGEVIFMGIDDPRDMSKLLSREIAAFAMDEPAPAEHSGGIPKDAFLMAMSRRRQYGMKWYAAKLAENSPDESHWTYQLFVDPGTPANPERPLPEKQTGGFRFWRAELPENVANLPAGYYEGIVERYREAGREDLVRRFARGEFGFQQMGEAVTPQWQDELHLADALEPIPDQPLWLMWDFGVLAPCCLITQLSPFGDWHILEAYLGDDEGILELIENVIKPRLAARFRGFEIEHSGDPAGRKRDDSSSKWSPLRVIKEELGGRWTPGARDLASRIPPLRSVLTRVRNGRGIVQVDKHRAKIVHHALRGGWHYNVGPGGVPSPQPKKDHHSHPGDCMSYGASILFPSGKIARQKRYQRIQSIPSYFGGERPLFENRAPGALPPDMRTIK